MNEKVKGIRHENTHFANASGLPNENHYVSVYDELLCQRIIEISNS